MIFTIVGPSGAGKDTLIAGARRLRPDLRFVRRVITKPSGTGGEDFESVTPEEFARRKAAGDFALDWRAYGVDYGIPRAQVQGTPGDVVFNGSRAALPQALLAFPGLRVILVTAPPELLAARLAARGREPAPEIAQRLTRAGHGLPPGLEPVTVMNDSTPQEGARRLLAALDQGRAPRPHTRIQDGGR
ncbi:MAG TPA: phosphonate metabolism protein/1,5-bisphosphokinase (PRPP-forming) PhnN [Paracoccus sp.]|nr:phosphonate metabolism protein/1,5-bisphosphokinase (PRPP-forming) PhnN [Paracoccus sp. (in: a-proteobacteria)]